MVEASSFQMNLMTFARAKVLSDNSQQPIPLNRTVLLNAAIGLSWRWLDAC